MSDRLSFTLYEVVSALDGYADGILQRDFGVSFNHFHFLAVLADVEPSDMTTLASCLGITKAAVSKRIPALVDDGWVTQEPGPGRSLMLTLTRKGAVLVRDAGAVLDHAFTKLLADPALAEDPLDPVRLNRQLVALTAVVSEAGGAR